MCRGRSVFFRIYPLDQRGRYQPPLEIECDGDEAARLAAAGLGVRVKDGCHIWQLQRFVGHYRIDGDGVALLVEAGQNP